MYTYIGKCLQCKYKQVHVHVRIKLAQLCPDHDRQVHNVQVQ